MQINNFVIVIFILIILYNLENKNENLLFSSNLEKISHTFTNENNNYIKKKFIKKNNFYTITTDTSFNNYGKNIEHIEPMMNIFTDKPNRKSYKLPLTEGLLKIFKKSHTHRKISKNSPNGTINFTLKNGEVYTFSVTFSGCTPPASNTLIGWIRNENIKKPTDAKHLNHLNNEEKIKIEKIYNNIKKRYENIKLEDALPKHINKEEIIKFYGNRFMDKIMRQCLITFKLLNKNDEKIFENLFNNNFEKILNVNTFIDSCPFWKQAGCLSTKAAIVTASLPEIGPEEVAIAISTFAAKDIIERIIRQFTSSNVSSIVNTIIRCTPLTPLCFVGPIVDHIYGCAC